MIKVCWESIFFSNELCFYCLMACVSNIYFLIARMYIHEQVEAVGVVHVHS